MPARRIAQHAFVVVHGTASRDAVAQAGCEAPADSGLIVPRNFLPLLLSALAPVACFAANGDEDGNGTRAVNLGTVQVTASAGAGIDGNRRALPVRTLDAAMLDDLQALDFSEALNRRVPGISLNSVQGNPLQPDLQYRGFTASPLLGTAQGLAVYQDGVRVNEVFGDTINWDLLPLGAMERVDVMAGADPVFGLNTLGGAISLRSKDGFSTPGTQLDFEAGSFGRRQSSLQSGGNDGRFGYYVYADRLDEDGWRDLSPSRAEHYYGDFGWRGERASLDLSLAHADTDLTGNGAAPVELLAQDRAAVFTAPDETANRLDQASVRGSFDFDDELRLDALLYRRDVRTRSYNGDGSDAEECEDDDGILCEDDGNEPLLDQSGEPVSSAYDAINNIGTRRQRAFGGSVQLASGQDWGGRDNQFVVGAEWLRGKVGYRSLVEPAVLLDDRSTSTGSGLEIPDQALDLAATTSSRSLYLTDTLALSPALSLTASLRWNATRVTIADRSGLEPDLNGRHRFSRINPALGLAWNFSPTVNLYASYSESARAPTAVELSCADEDAPCRLPNQFVSDPPLQQVVAKSWEAGLRGDRGDALRWQAGVYRTRNADDILFQTTGGASSNEGFFANVANTRRQGFEFSAEGVLADSRLRWYANYTWLDATFLADFIETSANHPGADADGVLQVRRGNALPGLSKQQLKAGLEWRPREGFSVGIDGEARSGVYLRGDEANLLGRTGGYAVFGLNARWQATPRLSLRLRVDNLFDRRYENFGVLGEPDEVFPGFDDPRFLGPGAPRGAWLGARLAF